MNTIISQLMNTFIRFIAEKALADFPRLCGAGLVVAERRLQVLDCHPQQQLLLGVRRCARCQEMVEELKVLTILQHFGKAPCRWRGEREGE